MKNFKKLISALLACTMICAVSVTSFAFSNAAGYYTVEFKVQDAEGNVITEAAAGSDVYVATYIYETANPNADVVIEANKSAELVYELDIPEGFMADEASYEGANFDDIDNVVAGAASGTATISDFVADAGIYAIENTVDITAGVTLSNDVAIIKNKVTLSENLGTYELMSFADTFSFTDGLVAANGCEAAVTEFEIVAAGGDEPTEDKSVKTDDTLTDGKGVVELTYGKDAENKTLEGKKVYFGNAKVADAATLTNTSRLVVTYNNAETKTYNIFAAVNAEGDGAMDGNSVAFGIIFTGDLDVSKFDFQIK